MELRTTAAPPMSPLGMNPIRAPGLTDFRGPLPLGLVFLLALTCLSEAQASPPWLQPPGTALGEFKTLTLLYLPGDEDVFFLRF